MGTGQPRWRTRSTASASSPPSSFTADPPEEFLCPISGTLMADPVIVPPGQTFERSCIQACAALAFFPPAAATAAASQLVLIPNVALRTTILNWCERLGLPNPSPISPDTARDIVRRLMPPPREQRSQLPYRSPPAASSVRTRSRRDDEFVQDPKQTSYSLEEDILTLLGTGPAEQMAAMVSLRQGTRESKELRLQLCTPRLLAALRPMLLSADDGIQVNAAAAMVNLSLEVENKAQIVQSGAVSPLVDILRFGHPEARDHVAGAIYSLAVEDENRVAIGVLGGIPPLLELFGSTGSGHRARREAGMALYHVSLSGTNRSKIARTPGVVRTLIGIAEERNDTDVAARRRIAMMMIANLSGCPEGRSALMDGGAVAAVVRLMRSGSAAPGSTEEEYCISALYEMSRGRPRFCGLARAAGLEAALMPVAERDGGVGRDMARRTLRVMRGEDDGAASGLWDDASVVSEGLVSFRRPQHRGNFAGPSGSNTTQF